MVAICAAVLSRSGKVLLARQFMPISKNRLEGYLVAFPKLLSDSSVSQHTFVETETIRYVFQPLESLFVVLITNKQSNILEDLDTLRLLAKLIPEYCGGVYEHNVNLHCFELLFAFDEVVGAQGYKEHVTQSQIRTYFEMDSHEEKLQNIILESKIRETQATATQKAAALAEERQRKKRLAEQGFSTTNANAMGSDQFSGDAYSGYPGASSQSYHGGSSGGGGDEGFTSQTVQKKAPGSSSSSSGSSSSSSASKASTSSAVKGKGMSLAKPKKGDDFLTQLSKEEVLAPVPVRPGVGASGAAGSAAIPAPAAPKRNVVVAVEEKLVVELDREGGVKLMEVKGEMKLTIFDPDDSRIFVRTNGLLSESDGYKCRLHPKINKSLWSSDHALGLQDASKGFPVGSDNAPVILKWQKKSTDESDVPFTLNFWPNVEDGRTVVSVEFTAERGIELHNVHVRIPCPSSEAPEVSSVDGQFKFEQKAKLLTWRIGDIAASKTSGTFEFSVPELDGDAFFPIHVELAAAQTLSGFQVQDVLQHESNQPLEYNAEHTLSVEKFVIA